MFFFVRKAADDVNIDHKKFKKKEIIKSHRFLCFYDPSICLVKGNQTINYTNIQTSNYSIIIILIPGLVYMCYNQSVKVLISMQVARSRQSNLSA